MDDRTEKSVGEAGDIIATAQRLIEAGVKGDDQDLIDEGKRRWKTVWPEDVVDEQVGLMVVDLKKELGEK